MLSVPVSFGVSKFGAVLKLRVPVVGLMVNKLWSGPPVMV